MPGERHSRGEIDAHLDDLASGDAEIVPQQIGALDSRLLRLRHVQRQTASDDQRRYRHDSSRFHVNLLLQWNLRSRAGRSDLNAARSSALKSSGCSHAAKCPPLSTSLK